MSRVHKRLPYDCFGLLELGSKSKGVSWTSCGAVLSQRGSPTAPRRGLLRGLLRAPLPESQARSYRDGLWGGLLLRIFLRPLLDIVPEDPRVPNFYILPKGLFGDLVQRWHALGSHQIAGSATTRRWVGSALLLPGRAFLLSRQGSRQRLAAPRLPPAFAATGD